MIPLRACCCGRIPGRCRARSDAPISERLLAAIDTHTLRGLRDLAMLEMAYGCGLRVSELTSLRMHQVDLGAKVVIVLAKAARSGSSRSDAARLAALKAYLAARHKAATEALSANGNVRRPRPAIRLSNPTRRCSSAVWAAR